MQNEKNSKFLKSMTKEKVMIKICKQKGWNINELTTGQMLYLVNHPDVKSLNK
jgi:hypothetical protein